MKKRHRKNNDDNDDTDYLPVLHTTGLTPTLTSPGNAGDSSLTVDTGI